MRYYYVRRIVRGEDKGVVEIPERDLVQTLKLNPLWKVIEEDAMEKAEQPKPQGFRCPVCDFVAKTEFGLKGHKRKHQ